MLKSFATKEKNVTFASQYFRGKMSRSSVTPDQG